MPKSSCGSELVVVIAAKRAPLGSGGRGASSLVLVVYWCGFNEIERCGKKESKKRGIKKDQAMIKKQQSNLFFLVRHHQRVYSYKFASRPETALSRPIVSPRETSSFHRNVQ